MTSTVDDRHPDRPQLPIDPRMQARRSEVHRALQRRRRRVLTGLAAAVALAAAAVGVVESPLASVRHVRLGGEGTLPRGAVLVAAGLDHSQRMVDIRPAAAAARLEDLAPVASATVWRLWPATVRIDLQMRSAVAVVVAGGTRSTVDRTGRFLDRGPGIGGELPVLVGVRSAGPPGSWLVGAAGRGAPALEATANGSVPVGGDQVLRQELAAASVLAAAPLPTPASGAATVSVATAGGLLLTLGPLTVVLGDPVGLPDKVAAVAAVVAGRTLTSPVTLDVRVPGRPVLRSTPAPAGAPATGAAAG